MSSCSCISLAPHFKIPELRALLMGTNLPVSQEYDTFLVKRDDSYLCCFPFGTLVFWGFSDTEREPFMDLLKPALLNPFVEPYTDDFLVTEGEVVAFSVNQDTFRFPHTPKKEDILAVSFALAKSTAFNHLEKTIEDTIAAVEPLPQELARYGKVQMGNKALRKSIGQILQRKHEVNLALPLSETPDYFWENPDLESYYHKTAKYLELSQRSNTLNQKLSILHETLDVLRDESNVRNSTVLEWVVIILIAIEIFISLSEYVFKYW
ncbi:MAG: RMD1 family protein [Candidatus Peregrinibacteria bacterium]